MTETHHNSHSPAFGSLPLHDLARPAIPESEDVAMAAQSHKIYGDSHTIEFFTEKAEQGGKLLWATVHVPAPNAEGAYGAVSEGKRLSKNRKKPPTLQSLRVITDFGCACYWTVVVRARPRGNRLFSGKTSELWSYTNHNYPLKPLKALSFNVKHIAGRIFFPNYATSYD